MSPPASSTTLRLRPPTAADADALLAFFAGDESVFALCEDVCGSLAEQLESLRQVVAGAGG